MVLKRVSKVQMTIVSKIDSPGFAAVAAASGGVLMAVISLIFPTYRIEQFVTSYGISELIPAAAPPLGSTARTLIAVAIGLFTASSIYILLNRFGGPIRQALEARTTASPENAQVTPSAPGMDKAPPAGKMAMANRLKALLAGLGMGKQTAKAGEISDFDDLPKLRMSDRHPDAPSRKPISAASDLGAPLDLGPSFAFKDTIDTQPVAEVASRKGAIPAFLRNANFDPAPDGEAIGPDANDIAAMEAQDHEAAPFDDGHGSDDAIAQRLATAADAIADAPLLLDSVLDDQPVEDAANVVAEDAADDTNSDAIGQPPLRAADDAQHSPPRVERPFSELSISELMERLDNGLAQRQAKAVPSDNAATAEPAIAAPGPVDNQAQQGADILAARDHRVNGHSDSAADQGESDEIGADQCATPIPIARFATPTTADDNELDEALKAALNTLKHMTERQRNIS